MPCLRQTSVTFNPASASLRIETIWVSVNLLFFMVRLRLCPSESSHFDLLRAREVYSKTAGSLDDTDVASETDTCVVFE
jgi:hypothetical protein